MSLSPHSKTNLAISKSYFQTASVFFKQLFFFHSNTTVIHILAYFFDFFGMLVNLGDRLKILLITPDYDVAL